MITLSSLKISRKSKRSPIVLGRGNASGKGNFSTRGVKGQRARTGGGNKLYRLGMRHVIMQTPKLRGFASIHPKPLVVNLSDLEKVFNSGDRVTPKELKAKGLIDNLRAPIKVLGGGQLSKSLTLVGCQVSAPAVEKVKKAGGSVQSIGTAKAAKAAKV